MNEDKLPETQPHIHAPSQMMHELGQLMENLTNNDLYLKNQVDELKQRCLLYETALKGLGCSLELTEVKEEE